VGLSVAPHGGAFFREARHPPLVASGAVAAKRAAAAFAVERFVRPGLTLALGTGSTAAEAVRAIRARYPDTPFDCVASSRATEELARSLGLGVRPLRADDRFDLMLDGADEVAPTLDLTKGAGGALLREKLLARCSARLVVLVDPSKLVRALGEKAPLPVEVVPFARPVLARELERAGYAVAVRVVEGGAPFVTDNGNEILDLRPPAPLADPRRTDRELRDRTGVVETGLFVGLAERAVVGSEGGAVEERLAPARPP
jgi:ribose 5-phosphate isomerase A